MTFGGACLALLMVAPVLAHHSFSTEYDRSKPVSVQGVVKKVEWQNPHIWFYVDVAIIGGFFFRYNAIIIAHLLVAIYLNSARVEYRAAAVAPLRPNIPPDLMGGVSGSSR